MCPFVSGLFHLVSRLQGPSVLEDVRECPSFLKLNSIPHRLSVRPCGGERACVGCFHLLAIVNSTEVNRGVQVAIQIPALSSSG